VHHGFRGFTTAGKCSGVTSPSGHTGLNMRPANRVAAIFEDLFVRASNSW